MIMIIAMIMMIRTTGCTQTRAAAVESFSPTNLLSSRWKINHNYRHHHHHHHQPHHHHHQHQPHQHQPHQPQPQHQHHNFQGVGQKNNGPYTCRAENRQGRTRSNEIVLSIKCNKKRKTIVSKLLCLMKIADNVDDDKILDDTFSLYWVQLSSSIATDCQTDHNAQRNRCQTRKLPSTGARYEIFVIKF